MRLPGCHSARVLPGILTPPRVQKTWLKAPRVSFYTCFVGDFEIRGVHEAWLEAPQVLFHMCFAEDFDTHGVPKAWLEATRVSFHTCFAGDLTILAFRRHGLRLPECHSARVLFGI